MLLCGSDALSQTTLEMFEWKTKCDDNRVVQTTDGDHNISLLISPILCWYFPRFWVQSVSKTVFFAMLTDLQ